jgi:putative endonuclease
MQQMGYFYIMSNVHNTVLYCGATNDLYKRVLEHKSGLYTNSFTLRYNINKLVYFEIFSLVTDAFNREKQVKAGSRKKKIALIENVNPEWQDLFYQLSSNVGEEVIRLKKFFNK